MNEQFTSLDPARLIATIDKLEKRITERFPNSGLSLVGAELSRLARDCSSRAREIASPAWSLRLILLGVSCYCGRSASITGPACSATNSPIPTSPPCWLD